MTTYTQQLLVVALLLAAEGIRSVAATNLCSIVSSSDGHLSFSAIFANGTLGPSSITLMVDSSGGMLGGSPAVSTYVYAPGMDDQVDTGLVVIDTLHRTAASFPLVSPPGFVGEYVIGALASSNVAGEAVGLLSSTTTSPIWTVVAELAPASGAPPRVRYNLSAEQPSLTGIFPNLQAFDGATRTFFFVATTDAFMAIIAVPLDSPAPPAAWLPNITVPSPYWLVGLVWAPAAAQLIAVTTDSGSPTDGTVVLIKSNIANGTWAPLTSFSKDSFLLDSPGVIAVDSTGALVSIGVVDSKTNEAVVVTVSVVTGAETGRRRLVGAGSRVEALIDCGDFEATG